MSFNGSCKVKLAIFGFLLMVARHGLLDFGTDKNAFVVTGTFGFSVPLAALKFSSFSCSKKLLAHLMVHGLVVHGVQRLVTLEAD